ncbi:hypothetical protein [Staphylococcus agnetis]|uniref:hypothetical protein n=1 Tax=Staphylococcus agnetis TaxID=985762 RepID=UPI000D1BF64B|nr:hypothetical protein [Staphylococcus agnetis]PTH38565.1 hypothetical protein BU588_10295 [Staphylococcus agnetis]
MVKIKTKKEMELPELLRWASDNGIKNDEINGDQGSTVFFNENGWVSTPTFINLEETFEVEIEEEITEDTIIPNLAQVWTMNNKPRVTMYHECTIQDFIDDEIEYPSAYNEKLMLYMVNDGRTMTLIYKYGEMVK